MAKDKNDMEKHSDYCALEGVPLNGEQARVHCDSRYQYPGNRRVPMTPAGPPAGTVLLSTAGNALQAVPTAVFANSLVVAGEDVFPSGYPKADGNDLHLNVVDGNFDTPTTSVARPDSGEPPASYDNAVTSTQTAQTDLVLVDVPADAERGSVYLVQIPDGRLVQTTIPLDPSVTQFYVRVHP